VSPADLAAAAMRRITEYINRSAAQHLRAMREHWARPAR
jgi:hypothetical protein